MAKKGILIGAGFVIGAFAAGLFIGKVGMRDINPDIISSTISGAPEALPFGQQSFDQARSFEEVRPEQAPRAPAADEEARKFEFSKLTLDTKTETPRACFQFSKAIDLSGDTNYADYVSFTPEVKVVATPQGRTVCFAGLDFETDYKADIRAGLPSAKGETLGNAETVQIAFGDKPAYVGFVGNGVILPRLEADGIGIETVNVDELKIEIRRIGDRAIAYKEITEGGSSSPNNYYYSYGMTDGSDVGVKIWDGVLPVKSIQNEKVVTVFPLGVALGEARKERDGLKPGAYYITISKVQKGSDRNYARASRWVLFTDMMLTTYHGNDGVDVVVRSLKTGRPVSGVKLVLLADNNDILAEVKSNGDGRARFSGPVTNGTGPLYPKMIMAYGPQDDFAVLDLNRSSLDLSSRDIGGRYSNGLADSFIYFDRGIYRPGEIVNISGMIRDQAGIAMSDRKATLIFRRPNYTEASRIRIEDMKIGGFTQKFEIPASAPRGMWTVQLEIDGIDDTQTARFSVEDFVPQRIAVELDTDKETAIKTGEKRPVNIDVRFLYGAPGSGLTVEGEARLRTAYNPFPDYKGYQFGDSRKSFVDKRFDLGETMTDGDGKAMLALAVDKNIESYGRPLRAEITIGVSEPGGRFVKESTHIPVRTQDIYIGVRRQKDTKKGNKDPIGFDIVTINSDGVPVKLTGLEWKLIEEDYRFEWYRQNGEWRWRRDYRDILIEEGSLTTKEKKPVELSRLLDYGSYRLELIDPQSGAVTTTRFYSGYYSYGAGAKTPDEAAITVADTEVTPGGRAKVTLDAPYAGEAFIAIATDRVHQIQRVSVEEGKPVDIRIDTDESWGAGFYVMATIVTPRDAVAMPIPRRAMGVAYVPFNMDGRKLKLAYDYEEVIRPRQNIELPVTIEGAEAGEPVMLTVAAVDEGILRITKFKTPNPEEWYFGKKALSVMVRDDYGRIMNPNLAAATAFGGDQLGGEGLTVVPTKSVALFNGIISVDGSGTATVPLDIPDFNGELRLMTVAWTADKVGSTARALTVRDAVPAELALPRFLGPNDAASTTLLVDNVEGETGVYSVKVSADGPVSVSEEVNVNLPKGERHDQIFDLQAGELGIADISLSVTGPADFAVKRTYPIQVRAPYFPVTEAKTVSQAAGADYTLPNNLLDDYYKGMLDVTVSYSPINGIDPAALMDSLYRYPYGCTEQLTSSSWPLLYLNKLGGVAGKDPERDIRPRVQEAINKILARQTTDGAFGLWRPGDRGASGWIGVYVTDFLYRAKQEGYHVPDSAMDKAYEAIGQLTEPDRWTSVSYITRIRRGSIYAEKQEEFRQRTAAYAFYALARAGRADLSDLRYFHDTFITKVNSPLAKAHAATALALMGDRARAKNAFKLAEEGIGYDAVENYYQSPLRDVAGMIFLTSEVDNFELMDRLTAKLGDYVANKRWLNTQEKAHLLMAASAMIDATGKVVIEKDGVASEGPVQSFMLSAEEVAKRPVFTNKSDGAIYRTVSVTGSPKKAPAAENSGYSLSKTISTLSGKAADLSAVQQNDRFIIVISGRPNDKLLHPSIVVDMLPPGFEIESVMKPGETRKSGPYGWVGELNYTKVAEARDDRFVAAIDLRRQSDRDSSGFFRMAYIVRAVTPGDYTMPGAVIEDMYRAGTFARTEVQRLKIRPAQ
ncbi:MAG: alpha-2-macroglobulin family protein [bacterium]